MKDIFHILLTGITTGLVVFLGFLPSVHAETIINDGFLQNNTVWDKAGSPYILNDTVTVSSGITLTIEPGVDVEADITSEYDPYIYVAGTLNANGTVEEPIHFGNIFGITIDHGRVNIENSELKMRDSLYFVGAEGHILSSTISNSVDGLGVDGVYINSSVVTISGSKIEGNANGIIVEQPGGVFQVRNDLRSVNDLSHGIAENSGGRLANKSSFDFGNSFKNIFEKIGSTLQKFNLIKIAQAADAGSSQVYITGSRLVNNFETSILNKTTTEVYADHNWWGSVDGPQDILSLNNSDQNGTSVGSAPNSSNTISNVIQGPVIYDPWLDYDPFDVVVAQECCSSVLFLPGLEASRLYRDEPGLLGIGKATNQLWEPNRNDDVRKLFLDSNGSSIDPSIFAGGPIDKALGLKEVYGSFMNFLDNLSKKGTIAEWKSYGYDWREPIAEVVAGRTQRATTTDSLLDTVEDLATRSKTGKVTLIAHSNGGLVAKYLVKTLADMGKENLIDSVISVAVPYLGTPQAILSLLHGESQSILGGLILKKSVAKELGTNMASAYSLLPSADYFMKVLSPTVAYASGTSTPITSASAQDSFISARANSMLMNAAEILHGIIDPFTWPATIARWAIVGWGNKTAKGIVYSGVNNSRYHATTTSMGDGTVIAPSAAYNSGTTTAVDLMEVSKIDRRDIDHSNILGASATKSAIEDLITINNHNSNAKAIEDALVKIPGVIIGEPDYSKETTFLVVSTHSPVELHLYDLQGNHTGVAPLPIGTTEDIEEGLYTYVEKGIIGSSFESYGDEQDPETYISVPDNVGQTYLVVIQGTGVGEFTYNVERVRGGDVLDSVTYASLPVTPLMTASTTVTTQVTDTSGDSGTISAIKLASSTPALNIDIDGNGSADISIKANAQSDPTMFLEALKKTVIQLAGSTKRSKNIVKRIDKLEDLVKKGKFEKLHDKVDKLKKVVTHKKAKVLSDADKTQIIDMIDVFITQFE